MRHIEIKDQVGIKRKCGCCGENFYISKDNIDDAIYYDMKTYHSRCFISMCHKRSEMKRVDISQKWTWVLNHLDSIKRDSYEHLKLAITKEEIFEFIKDAYDITIIPSTVWQKLGNIYSGTFKGMSNDIPPEHLLDMWQRKIDMLNGIASRNTTKGKTMSADRRINYDLTVLVNKYDSYLKWLEKQKIIEAENKQKIELKNTEICASIINTKASEGNSKQKNDDMSDLVDDIFED